MSTNALVALLSDMLYIDAPYGLRYAPWDTRAFDMPDYIRLFKQMEAMTTERIGSLSCGVIATPVPKLAKP